MKVYRKIVEQAERGVWAAKNGNREALADAGAILNRIEREFLPSGSGFDSGTQLLKVEGDTIKFLTAFHHMDDGGCYDGWTEHTAYVVPDFMHGFRIRSISGRNRNDIKSYVSECLSDALEAEYKEGAE